METLPEPEPDVFEQLAMFGLEKILQRRFETPIVTEITTELSLHQHRVTKDNFIEGL